MTDGTASTMSFTLHTQEGTQATIRLEAAGDAVTMAAPSLRRIIAIPAGLAAPYVNLFLHRTDLYRARGFLVEIGKQGGVQRRRLIQPGGAMSVVVQSLWLSALASTMKCFSSVSHVPS
jgi:hypothetical protein